MTATSICALRPGVEPFSSASGDLYLLRSDGRGDLVIRSAGEFDRLVVASLQGGSNTRPEIVDALVEAGHAGADVVAALAQLEELDLIETRPTAPPPLTPAELERYDRQLAYFADLAPPAEDRYAPQLRLRDARVCVLGAGGLGTWAMGALAAAGVGGITAVDDDVVDLSNLNRQILYRTSDIGRPKVEVAAEALGAFNRDLRFEAVQARVASAADVARLAADADFIVETADWPPHLISRWVNEAACELGVPHISAGQFPPRVRIGPTYVPGETGCFECQERQVRASSPIYDELVEARSKVPPAAATLGPASGLIGSLIAMEIVHALGGLCPPATSGRALILDLRDLSTSWEAVARDPDCPICSAAAPAGPP